MGGRFEDRRLLTGRGRFVADLAPPESLVARFLRAPIARGRIAALDVGAARGMPGVIAVLTAQDAVRDGVAAFAWDAAPVRDDGGPTAQTPRPLLSGPEIRHLGEPVAMVVATSAAAAEDAVEAMSADWQEEEPALPGRDGPAVWPGIPDNVAAFRRLGDAQAVAAAMASAAHVTTLDIDITRVTANPMEPRIALGSVDADGRLVLTTSTQSPFALRASLAGIFALPEDRFRVVAPDVGGSFGMKGGLFREDALVVWAARRLGLPVLWAATRSESFLSDDTGRDVRGRASLALDRDGCFTALAVSLDADVGAYLSRRSMGVLNNIGGVAGTYRTPAISAEVRFRFSNTVPTSPYRGFGRPEATYVVEGLIDQAARETGRDPADLRLRNLVGPEQMPFQTGLTFAYDCGDFPAVMRRALDLADHAGFAGRAAEATTRGRLRGVGISNPVEVAGGPLRQLRKDVARVALRPDGRLEVAPGCMSVGQGHETGLARMAAARFGIDPALVAFRQGDTDLLPSGRGSGGSAATVVSGAAVSVALESLAARIRALGAERLEVAEADAVIADGAVRVAGTDRSVPLAEIAQAADPAAGIAILDEFLPGSVTYPNGCHVCEVEIDPETGAVEVVSYCAVEDVGTVLNPDLVEGQMQGGIAQGLGQVLGERIRFDAAGQLLSGSFMDYRMPRAADMPVLRLETLAVPTAANPLGAKGVGEAGTVGALAAGMNAVRDALARAGVGRFEMPATPDRVWQALAAAKT